MEKIREWFYSLSVKLHNQRKRKKPTGRIASEKIKDIVFCVTVLLIPTIQFLIFYVGVNFNSLLLSLQSYDTVTGEYTFVGLENIVKAFQSFATEDALSKGLKNSLVLYLVGLLIGTPLAILFSYAVFKKVRGYQFLRTMLFLPSIISPIVMVLIFRNFVGSALPYLIQQITGSSQAPLGLLSNPDTQFGTLIFYSIWFSFGSSVLLYSGAMSGINESVIEAAKMDGASDIRELFNIVLPLIYPTFSTFIIVGIAGIFTNQMGLFSFYGTKPISYDLYTVGYYLYRETALITGNAGYPYIAAVGICISVFTIPTTFLVKYFLKKVGPKVD